MNIFIKEHPDCLREAYVNVGPIELGNYYDKAITALQNDTIFPGYRKGKVPPEVIEKNKSNELAQTVFSMIVQEAAKEMLDKGVKIYSEPNIYPITGLSRHSRFIFSLTFEVYPEIKTDIELDKYNIPYEQYVIDDKMIEHYMKSQITTLKEVDGKIQEKDMVTANILNKDYAENDKEIVLEANEISILNGHKKGDNLKIAFNDLGNYVIRFLGQIEEPLEIEITKIERKETDKLTDDVVKETTSYQTLDEYKEQTKKGLEEMLDQLNNGNKRKAIAQYFKENIEMSLPKSFFLEKAKFEAGKFLDEMNITEPSLAEMINSDDMRNDMPVHIFDQSYSEIALLIVIDKVIQMNNIEASASLVNDIAEERAKQNKMSLEEYKTKSTNDEWESIKRDAQRETAVGFILDRAKFIPKSDIPLIKK